MPTATVVTAWQDGRVARMAVRVAEGAGIGTVEYIGEVGLNDLVGGTAFRDLTTAQKKAALVAACKAVRDALPAAVADLNMTGTVTV